MTRNREYFRGYECSNCGNAVIIVTGPIPKFCDECGHDLRKPTSLPISEDTKTGVEDK